MASIYESPCWMAAQIAFATSADEDPERYLVEERLVLFYGDDANDAGTKALAYGDAAAARSRVWLDERPATRRCLGVRNVEVTDLRDLPIEPNDEMVLMTSHYEIVGEATLEAFARGAHAPATILGGNDAGYRVIFDERFIR